MGKGDQAKGRERTRSPTAVVIRLCGLPPWRPADEPAWRELPRKAAAMLAWLVLEGPTPRERLADLLWPRARGADPRGNLRGLLRDLRGRGVEPAVGDPVLRLSEGVRHDLMPGQTRVAEGLAQASAGALLGALVFPDLPAFEPWLEAARNRMLARSKREAFDRIAQWEAAGDLAAALAEAQGLLPLDPLDEAAHRTLMRLHALRGDQHAALQAFGHCAAVLHAEAGGALPSAATRALATLIEMGEALPPPLPARTAAAGAPARSVGREAEREALQRAWEAGGSIVLEGEPGIGKSRLLAEWVAEAPQARVASAALAGDAEVPFAVLVRTLRGLIASLGLPVAREHARELARLLPDLGVAPSHPATLPRMVEALAASLAAWQDEGLGAVVIDDLHWADEVSVRLLLQALSRVPGLRAGLALRSGQRPPGLVAALQAHADRWRVIELHPLQAADVEQWLASTGRAVGEPAVWAGWLVRHGLGNPLQIIELLRLLEPPGATPAWRVPPDGRTGPPVPPGFDALLRSRVARLDDDALQLARLAALAGPLFGAPLAEAVTGFGPLALASVWGRLKSEQVLGDDRLAHDSLAEPLLEGMPAVLARAVHARIAAAADRAGLGGPAVVARHWWLAAQWAEAAGASARAAAAAAELGARAEAARFWDQSAECEKRCGRPDAAFAARVQAFEAALEVATAAELMDRCAAIGRAARGPSQDIDAALAAARLAALQYRFGDAIAPAQQVLRLVAERPDGLAEADEPRAFRARLTLASALAGLQRIPEAMAQLEALQGLPWAGAGSRLQLDHLTTRGFVLLPAGHVEAAAQAYREALVLAEALDDGAEIVTVASNLAILEVRRGDAPAAVEMALRARAMRRRLDDDKGVPALFTEQVVGTLQFRLGRFDQALQTLETLLPRLREQGLWRLAATAESMLAQALLDLGQPERARQVLQPWPDGPDPNGRCLRQMVEREASEGAAWTAEERAALHQACLGEALVSQWAVRIRLARLEPPDQAAAACEAIQAQARSAGADAVVQASVLVGAEARWRGGDAFGALDRLEPALQRLARCWPNDMYLPTAWWIAHQVFVAAGKTDDAVQALASGLGWIEQALHHVPAGCRESFLHRNAVNRQLLQAAAQRGITMESRSLGRLPGQGIAPRSG